MPTMTREVIAPCNATAQDEAIATRPEEPAMTTPSPNTSPLLRFALLGDAVASGATGLLLAAASGPLAWLLGLPAPLLRGAGLVLLPYATLVAWLGMRPVPAPPLVRTVIAVNLF